MRGVTAVVVGALLVVFFLVLVAVMAWQEAKGRQGPPEYILNDCVAWVRPRLTTHQRQRLSNDDVLAVLEWHVHGAQQSVRGIKIGEAEVILGATKSTVAYICERALAVQGHTYDPADVAAVLSLQAEYLASIGVVGEPVGRVDDEMG